MSTFPTGWQPKIFERKSGHCHSAAKVLRTRSPDVSKCTCCAKGSSLNHKLDTHVENAQDTPICAHGTYVWNHMKSGTLHPSPICCHQLAPATLFGIREIAEPGKSAVLLRTLRQSPRLATKFQASTHQALTDSRLHKNHTIS